MKSFKLMLAVCLVCTVLSAPASAAVKNRIVAIVNDDVITLSEVEDAVAPYTKKIHDAYKGQDMDKIIADARNNVLNRMIDNLLIEQEVKKSGIAVKDEDVMGAIRNILQKKNVSMDEFLKILAMQGTTFEAYKEQVKGQMIRLRLAQRELRSKISVSDEEIGEYYVKNREDYEGKEAIRIKQILILLPKNSNEETREQLRADAEKIRERLKNGEPFEMLAARYSQGPAGEAGGDIGFIEKGLMLPEVEKFAFVLERDVISDVIESAVGFHIIKVIDKKGIGVKPIEDIREEIRQKIESEKMEKKYNEWIDSLRKRSHIAIKLE